MTDLLTSAQMRAIELAAMQGGGVSGLELMERAGDGVVTALLAWRPALAAAPQRAVVLCGPGNNGGDGFVIARLLRDRGWEVELFLHGDAGRLPPDAALNCRRWQAMGAVRPLASIAADVAPALGGAAVLVDALFGTGLARPLALDVDALPRAGKDGTPLAVVAVDIPSGLCSDSGRAIGGRLLPADLTVTFHRPKRGHVLGDGPAACGALRLVDIGLPQDRRPTPDLDWTEVAGLTGAPDPARLSKGAPGLSAHKYSHGHAVVLSGGPGKGGAARLAARGALRIGAGLVTLACPPAALQENAARLDAVMLRPVADAAALAEMLADPRFTAICLGPGLGLTDRSRALVAAVLGASGDGRSRHAPAAVLDADALTVFERDPESLFALLHANCVLTPHAGEFARLFPDLAERLKAPAERGPAWSKIDATRAAAARAGCTVLFKGPDTVIADPSGRAAVHAAAYDRAAPWLATAGAGDVLAGFIAGLMARGLGPMAAAEAAAWLHVDCARRFGPGLIAEDLPETLPRALRDLGA